jgi:hypothetical protein
LPVPPSQFHNFTNFIFLIQSVHGSTNIYFSLWIVFPNLFRQTYRSFATLFFKSTNYKGLHYVIFAVSVLMPLLSTVFIS